VQCPECDYPFPIIKVMYLPVFIFSPTPRQVEPYVKITNWQCSKYQTHHGVWYAPAEKDGSEPDGKEVQAPAQVEADSG
jgi:hypothetical protein